MESLTLLNWNMASTLARALSAFSARTSRPIAFCLQWTEIFDDAISNGFPLISRGSAFLLDALAIARFLVSYEQYSSAVERLLIQIERAFPNGFDRLHEVYPHIDLSVRLYLKGFDIGVQDLNKKQFTDLCFFGTGWAIRSDLDRRALDDYWKFRSAYLANLHCLEPALREIDIRLIELDRLERGVAIRKNEISLAFRFAATTGMTWPCLFYDGSSDGFTYDAETALIVAALKEL